MLESSPLWRQNARETKQEKHQHNLTSCKHNPGGLRPEPKQLIDGAISLGTRAKLVEQTRSMKFMQNKN
jgi:hypothetical protein